MIEAISLALACPGSGTATQTTGIHGGTFGPQGQYNPTFATANTEVIRQGTVIVNIEDGRARVRLPNALIPPLNVAKDGWFDVRDFQMTDAEIAGKVKINFTRTRKLKIDRTTGQITLGTFTGQCEVYDPGQRKF